MCNCSDPSSSSTSRKSGVVPNSASPSVTLGVPLAAPIAVTGDTTADQTADDPSTSPGAALKPCKLDFRDGCYVITHRPSGGRTVFEGTLRVDRAAPDAGPDGIIVSSDFYSRKLVVDPPVADQITIPVAPVGPVARAACLRHARRSGLHSRLQRPPAAWMCRRCLRRARNPSSRSSLGSRYRSFLEGTSVSAPDGDVTAACLLTIVAEQFNYTQPPAGQHKGTFPCDRGRTDHAETEENSVLRSPSR